MPRSKKPAGAAVDKRNGRRLELATSGGELVAPAIDRGAFLPETLAQWDAYWTDPVAASQTPADRMMVLTWLESYDDYRRKKADADKRPLVKGSMGQMVANPMYAVADRSLAVALACARQLGIGAKNRADLGLAIVAEAQTLASVNERYRDRARPAATPQGGDDDDPRIVRLA